MAARMAFSSGQTHPLMVAIDVCMLLFYGVSSTSFSLFFISFLSLILRIRYGHSKLHNYHIILLSFQIWSFFFWFLSLCSGFFFSFKIEVVLLFYFLNLVIILLIHVFSFWSFCEIEFSFQLHPSIQKYQISSYFFLFLIWSSFFWLLIFFCFRLFCIFFFNLILRHRVGNWALCFFMMEWSQFHDPRHRF